MVFLFMGHLYLYVLRCGVRILDFIYFDTMERKHSFIAYIFAFKGIEEDAVLITPGMESESEKKCSLPQQYN